MEKDSCFYDDVYLQGGNNNMYNDHYKQSVYYPIWEKALALIEEITKPNLIEVGCGVGQFANLLFDHNIINYNGIDYSKEAIKLAKGNNKRFADKFIVDDAYQSQIFQEKYNTVILFEVLEHLDHDLLILNKIAEDSTVLFSVPNFDSESHVRFFESETEILTRYSNIIRIDDIYQFQISKNNKLYLAKGIKKTV